MILGLEIANWCLQHATDNLDMRHTWEARKCGVSVVFGFSLFMCNQSQCSACALTLDVHQAFTWSFFNTRVHLVYSSFVPVWFKNILQFSSPILCIDSLNLLKSSFSSSALILSIQIKIYINFPIPGACQISLLLDHKINTKASGIAIHYTFELVYF